MQYRRRGLREDPELQRDRVLRARAGGAERHRQLLHGLDNTNSNTRINSNNSFPLVIFTNNTERIRFPSPGGNIITAINGAFLSSGGAWTNASSRELKKDIVDLDGSEALQAVEKLNPVKFQYKAEPGQQYVGFIAEDVPSLVAMNDRKSLNPMDVVAVLTKVVQEQQKTIEKLSARLTEPGAGQEGAVASLKDGKAPCRPSRLPSATVATTGSSPAP